jgi:hypothetical protein
MSASPNSGNVLAILFTVHLFVVWVFLKMSSNGNGFDFCRNIVAVNIFKELTAIFLVKRQPLIFVYLA